MILFCVWRVVACGSRPSIRCRWQTLQMNGFVMVLYGKTKLKIPNLAHTACIHIRYYQRCFYGRKTLFNDETLWCYFDVAITGLFFGVISNHLHNAPILPIHVWLLQAMPLWWKGLVTLTHQGGTKHKKNICSVDSDLGRKQADILVTNCSH